MVRWLKLTGLAASSIVVGILYGSSLAWAQTPTPTVAPTATISATQTATPTPATTQQNEVRPQPRSQGQRPFFTKDERQAVLAQALGMEQADLQQALATGKRLPQLLQERRLTRQSFQAALQKALADHLKQAVADGRITQQQADWWSQRLQRGAFGAQRGQMDQHRQRPGDHQPGMRRWDGERGPGGFRGWLWQLGHRLGWRWLVWLSQAGPMPGHMPHWR